MGSHDVTVSEPPRQRVQIVVEVTTATVDRQVVGKAYDQLDGALLMRSPFSDVECLGDTVQVSAGALDLLHHLHPGQRRCLVLLDPMAADRGLT